MKTILIGFMGLVAMFFIASPSNAFDLCYEYLQRRHYDKAIEECTKAINERNHDAHVDYFNRGNAYAEKGQIDQAIADYSKAIELNPRYDQAYNNRGNAYASKGESERAFSDYNKAIELNPASAPPYNNRGSLFLETGKHTEAERDIKKAIELNPDSISPSITMSEYYSVVNSGDEACRWLKKGIEKGFEDWNYVKTYKAFDNIRDISCYREILSGK